jgi:hypothetical protein
MNIAIHRTGARGQGGDCTNIIVIKGLLEFTTEIGGGGESAAWFNGLDLGQGRPK